MSSIPLQLVTGFLGSGKTTFLKNYLDKFAGSRRIGIIQNEFSDLNVDAAELKLANDGYEILEVNNGSVFCVCLLGSFVGSLAGFIDQVHPDELILEASGMSDPLSIGQMMQSPELNGKVFLDRVWCLVDAVNFSRMTGLNLRLNHQVRIADTVIVNKMDLVKDQDNQVEKLVKKLNPFAKVLATSYAKIDIEPAKPVMKFYLPENNSPNTRPADLESQVIKSNRLISRENMEQFLDMVAPECIRGKGYVNLDSGGKIFMQLSFEEVTIQNAEPFPSPTEFVLIGNFQGNVSFQKIFDSFCIS